MGHPELMRVADEVTDFNSAGLDELVRDLWDTMRAYGGIGLAATQIGEPWRVVVFGDETQGDPERGAIPRTVLINPVISPVDDTQEPGWEACLSVPGMRGIVPRYERIRYTGQDASGHPVERIVDGFHARVVQHECDHLDGILYPMRMTDMSSFGFDEELRLGEALQGAQEPMD
jgi:peptide deformylase